MATESSPYTALNTVITDHIIPYTDTIPDLRIDTSRGEQGAVGIGPITFSGTFYNNLAIESSGSAGGSAGVSLLTPDTSDTITFRTGDGITIDSSSTIGIGSESPSNTLHITPDYETIIQELQEKLAIAEHNNSVMKKVIDEHVDIVSVTKNYQKALR